MIPRLTQSPQVSPAVERYIHALNESGFTGDTTTRYGDRLTLATDNSIYQLLPQAIVFPRSTADVILVMRLAAQDEFRSVTFTPRGGGTGTNGQSLNNGVVIDLSRYMNRILEINPEQGWVRAEAGVIKDQLNAYLKPYGYFFAPELSTSNRATLGGMINTDASGQGSLVYGKTSDHVLGLRSVLLSGDLLDTAPLPVSEARRCAQEESAAGELYRTTLESCETHRQTILDSFPKLNRFLTGYDLRHVFSDDMQTFDLTRILTGSEGTLAVITEAKLNITPIPEVRRLVNVKYDAFDSALRNAPFMVEAQALSVETVDSKVLNLAREDIVWHSVSELITDVPDKTLLGLNIVEFCGDDEALIDGQVAALCERLDSLMANNEAGVIGYQVCRELSGIERIYAMRKKAVGLLGNSKGAAKPIPFVEDTCVPPEHLADYITEFRALLDSHHLEYGMFGHVDAGVLHVRPALDMCSPEQEMLMKQISDDIVALTAKYGGLLWGEHGKGFRAQYSEAFFGDTLYRELRRIKGAFDPENRLNPGKICAPLTSDAPMMQVDAIKRGTYDRTIPVEVRNTFSGAMNCNGNGLCFNFDVKSPMCPSMKVTQSRFHSPKGRAGLVREWLRLLAEQGTDPALLSQAVPQNRISLRGLIEKIGNTRRASRGEYDFSHEVKESMSGCLACKACSTQCPIKIDVPEFRARFLALYHGRYLRPLRDHLVANVEAGAPLMAKAPKMFNFFLKQPWVQKLSEKTVGMTDLPLLSSPSLKQQLAGSNAVSVTLEMLESMSEEQRRAGRYLFIVQDPFTSYFDAKVVADFAALTEKLGFQPVLLPFSPNGKAQHIKGFLARFARTANKTADFLNRVARLGCPMAGVDPALVLCYRDEYKTVLPPEKQQFRVMLVHEFLTEYADLLPVKDISEDTPPWYLFSHCTEATALPDSVKIWQNLFRRFGATLQSVSTGCCGMAGTYGHEMPNLARSKGIYQLSWAQPYQSLPSERCLTTGYSCRSQVKRMEGKVMLHPLQALLTLVS
ncbi:FAD-binding and (Fe-S)-binding domain-containing protein [Morganella morganii]|uniref:D-2-hydroxyglutarate dehydrogenase YdiJ n=1 Tax=Morganella morganii TaxID=582 RepID=UPI001BDA3B54|nr:FAD-binding and (Fe-S)-binding domain-containing protein [Morganella morganii]EKU4003440.1 FAD-binding oxidoreductase [Morganella morganii]MBT0406426.1 FAD-binding oxidoreductase [Morganella morganii subsp. morganii]MBT0425838.1 FAD-binding oxidoreductase [Morganella morganii subsp. morganii]MBT0473264.1 FAD-binding oxidoreductase [Morganella morganii subsp. morganii]QWM02142.1 FAD-binding oxidoreductase [Morganella morganii subsp. morganii]